MTKKVVTIWVYHIDRHRQKKDHTKARCMWKLRELWNDSNWIDFTGEAENALESRRVKTHMRRQQKKSAWATVCRGGKTHLQRCQKQHGYGKIMKDMDMLLTWLRDLQDHTCIVCTDWIRMFLARSPKTDFDLSDQAMRKSVSVWEGLQLPAAFPDWTALTYCWMRRDKPPAVSKRACRCCFG